MLIKKLNKEVFAWSIALIMGLTTFLVQSGTQKHRHKSDELKLRFESVQPEKHSKPGLDTETVNTAIVLDNSIAE